MHLIRSYLYIFLVLQLVFFSYCDDDVNPDGNVIENGKRNTNPLEPSVLPSSQNLGKGDPNIDLPAVENATKKNTDILLNVTDNKTDSADGGSSSKQKPSVKKELNQPLEFNVTTEIPQPLNITPHIVTVKITKIDNENSLKPSTPGEIHNTTSKVEGTPSNSTKVEDTAPLKSGAKKRGVIVFGTLGVLSIAYFAYKYYRKKKMQRENDSSFYQTDNQNFKYGVLLSNDNDDNLELSNLPLTVDSEDEEIEIFDIEQKKFLDNNKREAYGLRGNLLAKDDIEILDLDLPGTSDGSSSRTLNDDNLLNLSDVHLHDVSVIPSNVTNNGFKPNKANDFFDVL